MSFASLEFIAFFIIVLLGTVTLQRISSQRSKQIFLLVASYFFYGYWDWRFCFLLMFVTAAAYVTALYSGKKAVFVTGITVPLIVLGVFKYFNFFLSSFAALLGRSSIGMLNIILPVGISFYTFQALSYMIDVKRRRIAAEKDFIKLALYISFFPQLVAGPIIKAKDFLPQLYEDRKTTLKGLECGFQLMVFGLFKKLVLADHMSVFVDDVFYAPSAFHWTTLILAVVSYSLQIYFDFSGYSDIAIGCAKCLGYDFQPNFDLPYISQNVTEFWRRWHISLSTWLKEYLYIPLGGNRKGKRRQYINLFVTMLLGGLWHGANWTFVFWGGINGLALCADKLRKRDCRSVIGKAACVIMTYCFITFTWIFFRADTFATAWVIIRGIFTAQDGIVQNFLWSYVSILLMVTATVCAALRSRKAGDTTVSGYYPLVGLNTVWGLTLFFISCGMVLGLAFTGEAPFVYFQF